MSSKLHRTTRATTELPAGIEPLQAQYRREGTLFRPTTAIETFVEGSAFQGGTSYEVRISGPILKKDGTDGLNHGEQTYTDYRGGVKALPADVAVFLVGPVNLRLADLSS